MGKIFKTIHIFADLKNYQNKIEKRAWLVLIRLSFIYILVMQISFSALSFYERILLLIQVALGVTATGDKESINSTKYY